MRVKDKMKANTEVKHHNIETAPEGMNQPFNQMMFQPGMNPQMNNGSYRSKT